MKVHNTVKELLEAYAEFMFDYQGTTIESTYDLLADEFLASNSLALGKPEPLVKNKQTARICNNCKATINFVGQVPDGTLMCSNCWGMNITNPCSLLVFY